MYLIVILKKYAPFVIVFFKRQLTAKSLSSIFLICGTVYFSPGSIILTSKRDAQLLKMGTEDRPAQGLGLFEKRNDLCQIGIFAI